ncbi:MAG: hypothetical protein M3342_04615 [Bacteroidota bacterium]|nr:hypothetical protein [Flavisolibacter sp.]MDQ3843281.1 hypothetical protein [Bacteroidota bacterium]MBD0283904.1 hypothetical protein [Flavisolibacter sp.]MBD0296951.1 hypothetical protein [Flavisolibacter sp.]MBD0350190.1 hypothetical protein [Flavisolibacter sp.]
MKTVLGKLFVRFEKIANPVAIWRCSKSRQQKRKTSTYRSTRSFTLSPESFNVRGVAARSQDSTRRNAAP